ncbi:MAG: ammonium transporter [Acidimicrobiales bacterium]|jgi:Amt family ammonium transporter|nr:ammonium transporter [Acidimicrobiales bacterium]MDP6649796.1 ammonium transporter [Acidimicrobiales bacterium]MDP6759112.1 ammonium transporter [Acidimicrobiales bacterium]|tara:strand:- start:3430 stop:4668 length:1239 start_codon:yes stop_codon:yes gene_type:complete
MGSGDYAWMLTATALVVFMVPGLALFYGGMVRSRNVLNMLMMNLACIGIVPIVWVLISYSLGNSPDGSGFFGGDWIGSFDNVGLKGLNGDAESLVFVAFLMTFASITPALISGAVADRMRFSAWLVFVPIWLLLVYTPVTYWVYSGWQHGNGALDFAGGTAIHLNAGVAALAVVLVLGRRRGWPSEAMPPHNVPMVLIGTGILWFGWFGFNAGSAGAANEQAVQALLNTFLGASSGMVGWLVTERLRGGRPTTLGACSGVVAGLVAITPAAGYVGGMAGIVFGFVAGGVCFLALSLKTRFGFDDSLDVVAVHGVGGLTGGLLLGLFADASAIPGGDFDDGLFFGGGIELLLDHVVAMGSVIVFSFAVTWVLAKALDASMGLRVDQEAEQVGLDQTAHAESAYNEPPVGGLVT